LNVTQVRNWAHQFKFKKIIPPNDLPISDQRLIYQPPNLGPPSLDLQKIYIPINPTSFEKEIPLLRTELHELKKKQKMHQLELEHAQLERDTYAKVIEIAERELKINIKKK
jgi:hypothetical protein